MIEAPYRVVALSNSSSLEVEFSSLRDSIHGLKDASIKLDIEKAEAEKRLKKVLKSLRKRHALCRKFRRKVQNGICKLRKLFGKECPKDTKQLTDSESRSVTIVRCTWF